MTVSSGPSRAFYALGEERFASLTTFRTTGEPVSTPVWIARDGDTLVVTTPLDSGKVKRLRENGRVHLRACTRSGEVDADTEPVAGDAEILDEPAAVTRLSRILSTKYGIEFAVVMFLERVFVRREKNRVILKISAA